MQVVEHPFDEPDYLGHVFNDLEDAVKEALVVSAASPLFQ